MLRHNQPFLLLLRKRTPSEPLFHLRPFATKAQTGSWSSLSESEKAAWLALGYSPSSWEGNQSPPPWKAWNRLSLEEQSAAKYGLGVSDAKEWENLKPSTNDTTSSASVNLNDLPPLSELLQEDGNDENDDKNSTKALALIKDQETRLARQQQSSDNTGVAGKMGKYAYQTVKGLAPIVGPLLRTAGRGARGGAAAGMAVAGSLLENLPTMVDAASGKLDVTGIDTLLYLDDSGSMQGSNLQEGQQALQSLETRLKKIPYDYDKRFLPTRIVKFGNHAAVLNPSEEDWSVGLVNAAWDGSSGGTYMWKMIQDDIQNRYRPAGGKLRVVVITDGFDVLSPSPYDGVGGFNPLMNTLLEEGYDIEWNIIVVGNNDGGGAAAMFPGFQQQQQLTARDKKQYENLCRATGGGFLKLGSKGWDENDPSVHKFLDAMEESGYSDSEKDRRKRQEQYRLEARSGKKDNFDWLPKLPAKKDDDDDE